jgi:DeoR/GlpR family transcriptional regulator of sugar metabolism
MLVEIRTGRRMRINDLAQHFNVSTETIRRDLEQLSTDGLIVRTLGGATLGAGPRDPDFEVRMQKDLQLREQAARAALPLVENGDALFISSGVTSLQFAQLLASSAFDGTVITTSVRVANAFAVYGRTKVVLAPGEFDGAEQFVSGPETLSFLRTFSVDKAFFGASGLSPDAVTESRSSVAWNVRTMIDRANKSVLIADHTRFGLRLLKTIARLSEIDLLATDREPTEDLATALQTASVDVVLPSS